MKVKLLTALKVDDGRIMTPGVYDDAGGSFPHKLYNEIEYHRKTGRKTLEILEENKPKSSPIKESSSRKKTTAKDEEINIVDSGEENVTTSTSNNRTSPSRRKERRTSSSNT